MKMNQSINESTNAYTFSKFKIKQKTESKMNKKISLFQKKF